MESRTSRQDSSEMDSHRSNPSRRPRSKSRSPRPSKDRRRRSTSRDGHSDRRRERRSHKDESGEDRQSRRPRDEDSDVRHSKQRRDRRDRSVDASGEDRRERKPRDRSRSRDRRERAHRRHRSRSPPSKKRRERSPRSRSKSPAKPPPPRSRAALPSQNDSFRGEATTTPGQAAPPPEKLKPNFKPTGLLAKEANTVAGTTTVLKYHEPPEARKPSPSAQWRMYIFKKKDLLDTIYLSSRSVWLMGRDPKVADLLLEHPSISKQHAVIQFRYITSTNEYGDKTSKVKPYLIDLESVKGTKLNGKAVEASRFVELVDGDVLGFGESEREYVMMLPPAAEKK